MSVIRAAAGTQADADDRVLLRRIARRTWRYFEAFVGPDDQWLPPDNFQEQPRGDVAHRTSPTNIGMMFLSSLAACDLGYVGLDDLASRLTNSFDTLARIDRYRGHLLNWYDTRTLEPLSPRYVSTVDSGNLAVSLLALKEGCLEFADGRPSGRSNGAGSPILKLLDDALAPGPRPGEALPFAAARRYRGGDERRRRSRPMVARFAPSDRDVTTRSPLLERLPKGGHPPRSRGFATSGCGSNGSITTCAAWIRSVGPVPVAASADTGATGACASRQQSPRPCLRRSAR
jgi:hypothetical protein